MAPNTHPETGIRYGVISGNSLDPDVMQELFYGSRARDLTYEAVLRELRAEAEVEADAYEEEVKVAIAEEDYGLLSNDRYVERRIEQMWEAMGYDSAEDYVEQSVENRAANIQIEEPEIEGEYEGVKYRISWLGGAPIVFLLSSPWVGKFRPTSPCVPGAVDLDSPDMWGIEGYAAPPEWLGDGYEETGPYRGTVWEVDGGGACPQ